jgi:hypothetical protein
MLNEHVNVAVPGGGFQAVENVAEILAEVILNERAGFQFQRAEVADGTQFCRECSSIKSRAISGCVRNCLNVASWGVGVVVFFFIGPCSENNVVIISQAKMLTFAWRGLSVSSEGAVPGWFCPPLLFPAYHSLYSYRRL